MAYDVESKQVSKLKYPKSVAFIISKEFCERFNYYGMRTILVLYLTRKLGYTDDNATILFHVFTSLAYLFPIFGAIIADSWLGRFKTILYLSILYAFGSVIIAVGAIPVLNLPASLVTIIGLILISVGTGGIKPCVSAFGGDQFQIPEQAKQLATFFSLFYMTINAGSLISTTLTPILREDVHCFGEMECFSLAFGVPGILMVISICIFVSGKPFYKMRQSSGNMLVRVSKCIGNAIKSKSESNQQKSHWLDYAEPKYGKQLVTDVKILLKILVLFVPLPIFWALLDQQGSRWTFQATHMIGEIAGISIKPDQMQVLNPLLIVGLIPLFNWLVYPLLEKIGIHTPLRKLVLGMIFAAIAFIVSGFLELQLESTYPAHIPAGQKQIRIANGLNCTYKFIGDANSFTILPGELVTEYVNLNQSKYELVPAKESSDCLPFHGNSTLSNDISTTYFFRKNSTGFGEIAQYSDPSASASSDPSIRLLINLPKFNSMELKNIKEDYSKIVPVDTKNFVTIPTGTYEIIAGNDTIGILDLEHGGIYTVIVYENANNNVVWRKNIIKKPNTIHIFWQIPQYVIITIGEILFSVTGLEFSFTQAPESMKSVLQACWLLTVSFGNVIVIIVAEVKFFKSQAKEFFFFAFIMATDILFFIVLAQRYKYNTVNDAPENADGKSNENGNDKSFDMQKRNGKDNLAFTSDL